MKIIKGRRNFARKYRNPNGFTLIEILLVMGIIAILAAVVIVAINPARQFAQARNSQRTSNVYSVLNAVSQNMADNHGVFDCAIGAIPSTATVIKSSGGYDAAGCLAPTYLPVMPFDPSAPEAHFTSNADYDTAYTIVQDNGTGRITVAAPEALNPGELNKNISATR